jgi:hypothetical protein
MRCGRRDLYLKPRANDDFDLDSWRPDGTCSYCGSISPDELFTSIEANEKIVPTDKSYKIYVGSERKFYFTHLSEKEMQRFIDLFNSKKMNIGVPGYFYQMPFFMGYTEPERL